MVTYDFYKNSFLGSAIPEDAFSALAAKAAGALEKMKRTYRVEEPGETSEKMALCAMAETLYSHGERKAGISQVQMGQMRISYSDCGTKALFRELMGKASVYLDFYRGVQV
ncbi:MAG: hypothetical protein E7461_04370 [Ruminococcaceae bacterium]|nr:hypothetical protein [Oscillospiraceae bacterium]